MLQKIYAIRDSKGEFYSPPFYKATHGEAERDFRSLTNDSSNSNNVNKYPEDYDLFFLGDFDNKSGKINPIDTPQHIVKAIDLKS